MKQAAAKQSAEDLIKHCTDLICRLPTRNVDEFCECYEFIATESSEDCAKKILQLYLVFAKRAETFVATKLGVQFGRWWAASRATNKQISLLKAAVKVSTRPWPGRDFQPGRKPTLANRLFLILHPEEPVRKAKAWWAELVMDVLTGSGLRGATDEFVISFVKGAVQAPRKKRRRVYKLSDFEKSICFPLI